MAVRPFLKALNSLKLRHRRKALETHLHRVAFTLHCGRLKLRHRRKALETDAISSMVDGANPCLKLRHRRKALETHRRLTLTP